MLNHVIMLFTVVFLSLMKPSHIWGQQSLDGHWEGGIMLRGVSWPLEMDFDSRNTDSPCTLTIRSMGFVGKRVEVNERSKDSASVNFPFGLGQYNLEPEKGLVVSHFELDGGRRISLILEKIDDYKLPYQSQEVSIKSGDQDLKGTLFLPNQRKDPLPGVVILHGSASRGRDSIEYRSWADFYTRKGIATLVYDKRNYDDNYPDLSELAADAKSVLTFMQERPEIDNSAVGFAGGSQAAWLASSVVSQPNTRVAFVIMSGWPSVTPAEQESKAIEMELANANLSATELKEAKAYISLYFYCASTGQLWDQLKNAAENAKNTKWGDRVPIPNEKSDLDWWFRNAGFPAQQYLHSVRCPVLACYGENDTVVPPAQNAQQLQNILTKSGNNNVTVKTFPDADHRIEMPMIINADTVRWPQLSPDYLRAIDQWLRQQNIIRNGK
jgi:uncharacterized protein